MLLHFLFLLIYYLLFIKQKSIDLFQVAWVNHKSGRKRHQFNSTVRAEPMPILFKLGLPKRMLETYRTSNPMRYGIQSGRQVQIRHIQ